ncbi:multidrug ABC transporter ATP-binding protein [Candidatus Roizmanbacteria bacterium CG_4_10_14_0_8_um_filter_33_9]|uniref:Multidrug ABC transporter ATP-binding protein n=1 Tax=Candidatus Roizmanbacteria bacterium CG_4_10_14_0_8_um_filter_33_9 TaxID=1974826 RepID=A0A2M7QJA4_9BACT|nr:MAG: multidrug ABC transporter ATP-binding protein [Candidatus Roizmanbacteria bacterium CG_4_10_14_0_8_um_filter_33_9]
MIAFSHVNKIFGTKTAISDLTFTAKQGEIIGLLGPNGAGKTTTMRLLVGYLIPTKGTITVNDLSPYQQRYELSRKIGYLPENNPLYGEMKVVEYLSFISSIKKEKNVKSIIDSIGLSEVMQKKIEELSRGYKQRVGLAAALMGAPEILVLDEPTSGLDPIEQEKIRDLIKKFGKQKTIIFSTHILSEIETIADKIIIINEGKLVYQGVKPKGKGAVEKLFKKVVKIT